MVMTPETLLGPAVPATYLVLLGLEALRPARAWPVIRFRRLLGERGVHYRNFGDLPLWDMVFGTCANPQRFDGAAGFDPPAARRVGAVLAFADVQGARR